MKANKKRTDGTSRHYPHSVVYNQNTKAILYFAVEKEKRISI